MQALVGRGIACTHLALESSMPTVTASPPSFQPPSTHICRNKCTTTPPIQIHSTHPTIHVSLPRLATISPSHQNSSTIYFQQLHQRLTHITTVNHQPMDLSIPPFSTNHIERRRFPGVNTSSHVSARANIDVMFHTSIWEFMRETTILFGDERQVVG